MATMIPNRIPQDAQSDAEKKIYRWFRDDPTTKDWIVLYSLRIPEHVSLIDGEEDFVVLAPNYGLFALEVKGGRLHVDNEGNWHFIDRNDNENIKNVGPFQQADKASYSIQKYIKNHAANKTLARVIFGYGVMFPDIEFNQPSEEWAQDMVFDSNDHESVGNFIRRLSKYWQNRWLVSNDNDAEGLKKRLPTKTQIDEIADLLRPAFDFALSLGPRVNEAERQFLELTKMEFMALDSMQQMPRVMFLGSAGTGKTLVAVESIRRTGKKNIAFICYNKKLADWISLRCSFEGCSSKLSFVGTLHSLIVQNIQKAGLSCNWSDPNLFQSDELLEKFIDSLSISPLSFSSLVVDEVQDLFADRYLDVLDLILEGGLRNGSFYFFGDFDNQSIYDPNLNEKVATQRLMDRGVFAPTFTFTQNCRNTKEICDFIKVATGISYDKVFREVVSGITVEHVFYNSEQEEANQVQETLQKLKKTFKAQDIVVLSPKSRDKSCVRLLPDIVDYCLPLKNKTSFSTVQGFKGLESKAILLVDLENYQNVKESGSLTYVAVSRARDLLTIFETRQAFTDMISKSIKK